MILYPNDRKLLRTLRKIQKSETNFLFISADYTFCVPIEKPDPKHVQLALEQQRFKFTLEPPEVQGALISLENNLCIYHPGGQYVQVTPYGWRWKYLSHQNMEITPASKCLMSYSRIRYNLNSYVSYPRSVERIDTITTVVATDTSAGRTIISKMSISISSADHLISCHASFRLILSISISVSFCFLNSSFSIC